MSHEGSLRIQAELMKKLSLVDKGEESMREAAVSNIGKHIMELLRLDQGIKEQVVKVEKLATQGPKLLKKAHQEIYETKEQVLQYIFEGVNCKADAETYLL